MTVKEYDNFTVRYMKGPAHVDFQVYEKIAWENGDRNLPYYEGKGGCGMDDKSTKNIDGANRYIQGFVKWDGCSHINFGEEDGYIHLCGSRSFKDMIFILERIYKDCCEIGGFNHDKWDQ